jgi:hypothetical protein
MGASRYIHLEVERIVRETDAAFLVVLWQDTGECDAGEELWLPKTQIADAEDYEAGDGNVTLSITEWIAEQKGLV